MQKVIACLLALAVVIYLGAVYEAHIGVRALEGGFGLGILVAFSVIVVAWLVERVKLGVYALAALCIIVLAWGQVGPVRHDPISSAAAPTDHYLANVVVKRGSELDPHYELQIIRQGRILNHRVLSWCAAIGGDSRPSLVWAASDVLQISEFFDDMSPVEFDVNKHPYTPQAPWRKCS